MPHITKAVSNGSGRCLGSDLDAKPIGTFGDTIFKLYARHISQFTLGAADVYMPRRAEKP
jgi:hypothetical protein